MYLKKTHFDACARVTVSPAPHTNLKVGLLGKPLNIYAKSMSLKCPKNFPKNISKKVSQKSVITFTSGLDCWANL